MDHASIQRLNSCRHFLLFFPESESRCAHCAAHASYCTTCFYTFPLPFVSTQRLMRLYHPVAILYHSHSTVGSVGTS